MNRNLRGRIERLEKARPAAAGRINWANLCCGGPDRVVPDGSGIDWFEMFRPAFPGEEQRAYDERYAAFRRKPGDPGPAAGEAG